jgi:hypothetical protein
MGPAAGINLHKGAMLIRKAFFTAIFLVVPAAAAEENLSLRIEALNALKNEPNCPAGNPCFSNIQPIKIRVWLDNFDFSQSESPESHNAFIQTMRNARMDSDECVAIPGEGTISFSAASHEVSTGMLPLQVRRQEGAGRPAKSASWIRRPYLDVEIESRNSRRARWTPNSPRLLKK